MGTVYPRTRSRRMENQMIDATSIIYWEGGGRKESMHSINMPFLTVKGLLDGGGGSLKLV